ncbi:MAG: SRPBCC family protein [bacterium]
MGRVKVSLVARAPLEKLYEMAHVIEDYPGYIPALRKVRVIERSTDGSFVRAEWHAIARLLGATRNLVWVQDDNWDDSRLVCRVSLHSGNEMKELKGELAFRPHPKGTEMVFDVDFRVEHPFMTPIIHRLLDQVMRKNNESMLMGLKRKAEQEFWEQW